MSRLKDRDHPRLERAAGLVPLTKAQGRLAEAGVAYEQACARVDLLGIPRELLLVLGGDAGRTVEMWLAAPGEAQALVLLARNGFDPETARRCREFAKSSGWSVLDVAETVVRLSHRGPTSTKIADHGQAIIERG